MKKLLIAITVLVLFFALIIGLAQIRGAWEPTSETKKMITKMEAAYNKTLIQLPLFGNEIEINPENQLKNVGYLKGRKVHKVLICQEEQLRAISAGNYNIDVLESQGNTALSSGEWSILDLEYSKSRNGYQDVEHERDVSMIYNSEIIGLFRTEGRYNGNWEGDLILEQAWFKGWFFLLNVSTNQVVACKRIEVTGGSETWDWKGDGEDPLEEDLNNSIVITANETINEWCGTKNLGYFNFFDPDTLD